MRINLASLRGDPPKVLLAVPAWAKIVVAVPVVVLSITLAR
jgi:hypothetical protein